MDVRAPFLKYDDLRHRAQEFLEQYHPSREIPVPIELIVESQFGIDIVPVPGLQDGYDTVAYITSDLKEIRVDEYVYSKRINRYKFSLAHEIGHQILHGDIYDQLEFSSIAEWKDVQANAIPDDQYSFIEYHANSFAGLVLAPSEELREKFLDFVLVAQECGIDCDDPETGAREHIERLLAIQFEVSANVIHRRVEDDSLWH